MRIYLDTNVFIALVEGENTDIQHALWQLFSMSEDHDLLLITSVLSIAELLVKPLELGQEALASTYVNMLEPGAEKGLAVVHIGKDVLILAAHVRKDDKSIKLPDAIHLATAEHEGCAVILTNDRHLALKRPRHCRPVTVDAINALMKEVA